MNWFGSVSSRLGTVRELLEFLWERKLWWLFPVVLALLIFGLLMVFAQSSPISPLIYTIF